MLIEPASKVSVPLAVVMRTIFNVPAKEPEPEIVNCTFDPVTVLNTPEATHILPEILVIVMLPLLT